MKYTANHGSEKLLFGMDSVTIQKFISGIPGGRTLDTANWPLANVFAGTVAIKLANGDYAPYPIKQAVLTGDDDVQTPQVNEDGDPVYIYDALPEGAKVVGIVYRSVEKTRATASIMIDGVVNEACVPFALDNVKAALVAACPNLIFLKDEEA